MTSRTTMDTVRIEELDGGAVWRVVLAAPKGNILDTAMIGGLTAAFERAADAPGLKCILLTGEGKHFSFGASVEEHLPDQVGDMLTRFHALFARIAEASVPVAAVVQGQCLGGGLELASFCHRVFASPDARLGQPEIALGVFAPVASAALALRVGQPAADDLCLTGRLVGADEALSLGLVDVVETDPDAAAQAWFEEHLRPRSAAALRIATRASRLGFMSRFSRDIEELTRIYLDDLMATSDAVEGIRAFLEKREPVWSDR